MTAALVEPIVQPGWIACVCGGRFALAFDGEGKPLAMHSLPWCLSYRALETTGDAVAHARRCHEAAKAEVPS